MRLRTRSGSPVILATSVFSTTRAGGEVVVNLVKVDLQGLKGEPGKFTFTKINRQRKTSQRMDVCVFPSDGPSKP